MGKRRKTAATARPVRTEPPGTGVPAWFHATAGAWVAGMLALAALLPARYDALLQEDRFVEWWTVGLFAAAGVLRLRAARPQRRVFDLLVALFCLFVAGEEFSWGQRLLGFTPPAAFLEHNAQQELSLHNFADVFGKPKGVLMLALAGYGVLLPLADRLAAGRRALAAVGATAPPAAALPWFAGAVALLGWYPIVFTGEWVEALAGAAFLITTPRTGTGEGHSRLRSRVLLWPLTALAALGLTTFGDWRSADPERLACAQLEVNGLLRDIRSGAVDSRLLRTPRVHTRLFTAVNEGFIDGRRLGTFAGVACADDARRRRQHGIDPWGMAYWVQALPVSADSIAIHVYSMGPNRRRDQRAAGETVDDLVASARLARPRAR